jgi:hypothetical protein
MAFCEEAPWIDEMASRGELLRGSNEVSARRSHHPIMRPRRVTHCRARGASSRPRPVAHFVAAKKSTSRIRAAAHFVRFTQNEVVIRQ